MIGFGSFFSSPARQFGSLNAADQRFISISMGLAYLMPRQGVADLMNVIHSVLGRSLAEPQRKKVETELAIALVSCLGMPDDPTSRKLIHRDPEFLRELVGMLILSESGDERNVISTAHYSRNDHEARLQAIVSVGKLLARDDGSFINALNCAKFTNAWLSTCRVAVSGALKGEQRSSGDELSQAVSNHISRLSVRGRAIIGECIKKLKATY